MYSSTAPGVPVKKYSCTCIHVSHFPPLSTTLDMYHLMCYVVLLIQFQFTSLILTPLGVNIFHVSYVVKIFLNVLKRCTVNNVWPFASFFLVGIRNRISSIGFGSIKE